jgi:hypothetical protein
MPALDHSEWITRLDLLHARIRTGEPIGASDERWYREARRALLTTAVGEQNLAVAPGERTREAVRLDHAVPVTLGGEGWVVTSTTSDLGVGGFAAYVGRPGVRRDVGWATLQLGEVRLRVAARLVGETEVGEQVRVSCRFEGVTPDVRASIEDFLLDALLPRIVFWDAVLQKVRM